MKKLLKILLLIIGIVYTKEYPALWVLIITYIIYNYFSGTVAKVYSVLERGIAKIFNIEFQPTSEPRNWREAMAQSQSVHSDGLHDDLKKRRAPYMHQAEDFGFRELQKMAFLKDIPLHVLSKWSKLSVNNTDRTSIESKEIKKYFPKITKRDTEYMIASIQHTCRSFWDITEAKAAGCTHYIWSADDNQHTHMNNLVCPIDEQIPSHIVNDPDIMGASYPGEGYRCLCMVMAVLSEDDAPPAPIRLYENGKLRKITKKEFIKKCVPR